MIETAWELVLRLDARWWLAAELAELVVIFLLVVPGIWRRRKARRAAQVAAAAREASGVRMSQTSDIQAKMLFEDLRDDCLRRGWPLPDAQWIARRACELGGSQAAVTEAEAQVGDARGEGW